MWAEFVERKADWIGGTLVDTGNTFGHTGLPIRTPIVDMSFKKGFFAIHGERFSCGGDRTVLGIAPRRAVGQVDAPDDSIFFIGYGGHRWWIEPPTRYQKFQTTSVFRQHQVTQPDALSRTTDAFQTALDAADGSTIS